MKHEAEHYRRIAIKILEPWTNPPDWQGLQEMAISMLMQRLQTDRRFYKAHNTILKLKAKAIKD